MNSTGDPSAAATEEDPSVGYVAYIVGETLIAALTAVGNGLVIGAILKYPQLQTTTNYFVASLAAADFLVGVLGIPCAVVSFVGLRQSFASCVLVNIMVIVLTQISVLGLCAVAVDRFIAIRYPYRYAESCTATLCLVTIGVVWLAGVAIGALPLFLWNRAPTYGDRCAFTAVIDLRHVVYVNFFVCTLAPLGFIFAVYCYIFRVVRLQIRRIAALQQPAAGSASFRRDARAAKWFAVVIALFAISWLPLHVMNSVTLYGGPTCLPCLLAAIVLSHANSAVNPVLYAYANSKFKSAFKQMLGVKEAELG